MKSFLLLLVLSVSAPTHAQETDPNYCHGDDVCETGKWNPLETNVLRARGYGRTRRAAAADSDRQFSKAFPNQSGSCGIFSGPYNFGTYSLGDGTYASWTICPLRKGSGYSAKPRPSCGRIFGVWTCR